MHSTEQTVLRDLVLVGGGHSHVVVLHMFAMKPEPGLRITLICTDIDTPYSGMLPGYISGHYGFDDVHIDLGRLAAFAGARFIHGEVIGLDRAHQRVLIKNRPDVRYDVLSINTGSTPDVRRVQGAQTNAVPVKPIARFNQRWLMLIERVRGLHQPMTIAVVGGGAGGVELLLSMQFRLRQELQTLGRNPDLLRFVLLTAGDTLLPTHNPGVRDRFVGVLKERHVAVHTRAEVTQVAPGCLQTQDGRTFDADETVWVTRAGGPAWLVSTGLSLDKSGFIKINDRLQTLDDPKIFAAGDVTSFTDRPLEKAGVFAVRMGPPLANNLRRSLRGLPLLPYRPQRHWLALISTGDRYAVASRGSLAFAGAWVWTWKDWIDRRFMRRFNELPAMARDLLGPAAPVPRMSLNSEESRQAVSAAAMRCGGCGAKVGAGVLDRALSRLQPVQRDDVLIGLHEPDDAAVVRVPQGKAVVHTVDFFRSFYDDPYLFGKVAATHALGDIFAMGAEPQSATAIVTVPPGLEAQVEDLLLQLMTGAVEVLNAAGCCLVGGHTGEGRELALGFAVNGLVDDQLDGVLRKGGMRPGDLLLLTKPIGTGTLFAAHARHAARGRWIDAALRSMLVSNQAGAQILRDHGATACTDVTGFGLLGHLLEMTRPAGTRAELQLSALHLLDGALECVRNGFLSSLQADNLHLHLALDNRETFAQDPRYPLLFDPQTAGGLLASVPAARASDCLAALRRAGYPHAVAIGRVIPGPETHVPVALLA